MLWPYALVRFGTHSPPLARLQQSQRRFLIDSIIVRKELLSLRFFPSEGDDAVAGFVTPAGMASGRNHAELVVLFKCRERQALASTAGADPPRRIAYKRLRRSLGFRRVSRTGGGRFTRAVPSAEWRRLAESSMENGAKSTHAAARPHSHPSAHVERLQVRGLMRDMTPLRPAWPRRRTLWFAQSAEPGLGGVGSLGR